VVPVGFIVFMLSIGVALLLRVWWPATVAPFCSWQATRPTLAPLWRARVRSLIERPALQVRCADQPGEAARFGHLLADAGVNVEALFEVSVCPGEVVFAIAVDKLDEARAWRPRGRLTTVSALVRQACAAATSAVRRAPPSDSSSIEM
jgi:ACT domain